MSTLKKIKKEEISTVKYPQLTFKKNELYSRLVNKKEKIAVVGLGYVGLPLAVHMAAQFKVVGFDINAKKVLELAQHRDPCKELKNSDFKNKDIIFTNDQDILKEAKFYIIAVPTPIDHLKKPKLTPLKSATATVAKFLKKGDCVVFESTVFPGCTEEICVPILERISRLKFNRDFTIGYSPERINPGDKKHTFKSITKIVSGSSEDALELVAQVYETVVTAGIHRAPTIKVAEAAKVVENIQRDVNIGLMNELSQIFNTLDINTKDVLTAAGTKWNFHNYYPGLVGGHCIGVDPYYLINKAIENKYSPRLLQEVRKVNEGMISHIIFQLERRLYSKRFRGQQVKVLVKGITFKENVNDIRNSKVGELCVELHKLGYHVIIEDYMANNEEVKREYGLNLSSNTSDNFDVILLAVDHDDYRQLSYNDLLEYGNRNTLIFDFKGDKRDKFPGDIYMSL